MKYLDIFFRIILLYSIIIISTVNSEHWAIIVAGSNGYMNYRHQADACHAYHIVRQHGIPKENIILMMYDDIAYHQDNPFPGKLYNRPTTNLSNAINVYEGCNIDYRMENVTVDTFLSVLKGDATTNTTTGHKVLNSTKNDRVFINFIDHGSRGELYFPHYVPLRGKTFLHTLQYMYTKDMYKELVIYIEACHSGSLFWSRQLRPLKAFVTTAANGFESSFAIHCPPYDIIGTTHLNTCMGDFYSVNWMEDSDREDLSKEMLLEQYKIVKKETNFSHVMKYGDESIGNEIVGEYQGEDDTRSRMKDDYGQVNDHVLTNAIEVYNVPLVSAFYSVISNPRSEEAIMTLKTILKEREQTDSIFSRLQMVYTHEFGVGLNKFTPIEQVDDTCYNIVSEYFKLYCSHHTGFQDIQHEESRGYTDYSVKYAGLLMGMCNQEIAMQTNNLRRIIAIACE